MPNLKVGGIYKLLGHGYPWLLWKSFSNDDQTVWPKVYELESPDRCVVLAVGWRQSERMFLVMVNGDIGWLRRYEPVRFEEIL